MPRQVLRKRAALADILPAIRTKLADDDVLDSGRIYLTIEVDKAAASAKTAAPHDIFIGVGEERLWGEAGEEQGRSDFRVTRLVEILIRTRNNLDKTHEWTVWLTHDDRGHLLLEDSVIDSLFDFFPEDDQGNELTAAGLTYIGARPPRPIDGEKGWGGSVLQFRVVFMRDLTGATDSDQS